MNFTALSFPCCQRVFSPLINTITVVDRLPLRARTLWSYPSILSGAMAPCCRGLRTHVLWSYAPVLCGPMRPYFMGLCTRTVWVYAPLFYGVFFFSLSVLLTISSSVVQFCDTGDVCGVMGNFFLSSSLSV